MKDINLQDIYKRIDEKVENTSYVEPIINFDDIYVTKDNKLNRNNTFELFKMLEERSNTNIYDIPLSESKIKRFIQKVFRKFAAFLLLPITDNQHHYNFINEELLKRAHGLNRNETTTLENFINNMDKREKDIEELETRIIYLEKEIEELKKKGH